MVTFYTNDEAGNPVTVEMTDEEYQRRNPSGLSPARKEYILLFSDFTVEQSLKAFFGMRGRLEAGQRHA